MTVYARIFRIDRQDIPPTILAFDDEKVDHGFGILRMLDERHPGERDAERDRRWMEMRRKA